MEETTIQEKKEKRERNRNSGQTAFKQPRRFAETDRDFSFDDRFPKHTGASYDHTRPNRWEKESKNRSTRGFDEYPDIKEIISTEPGEEFVFLPDFGDGQWVKTEDIFEDVYSNVPFQFIEVEKGLVVRM